MPINEGDNPAAIVEPAGEGTLESPYNVAYVRQICGDLEQTTDNSDKKLSPEIYVKGIVSKVETDGKNAWSSQYGNITYYISDDGKSANEFEVYRGLGLDGAKFASQDGVNVGDEVVVCGKVLNFKGTYEFDQGSKLVSINGSGDTPTPTPTPTGENLLVNGDFETWANDLPTHWKSASAAGNASLSQEADDVHGGDFAVAIAGVASANKRMAYEEITLKAGTYKFSLFAKSTTTDKSQTRVGYVTVVNGTADSQGYKYGDYVNLNNNDWTECSTTFTLTAQTTICLVVMNPKTNGEYSVAQTILVDDASLVTSDGGIADGDDSGDDNGDDSGDNTFDQDFTKGQGSWVVQNVEIGSLSYVWQQTTNYGMKASAFVNKTNNASEAWLISPALEVGNKSTLSINNCLNFLNSGTLSDFISIMVSTDYSDGLPSTATWTALDFAPLPDGKSYTWVDSKADISAYANKTIRVAFKYVSTSSIAPTWEIKTVSAE